MQDSSRMCVRITSRSLLRGVQAIPLAYCGDVQQIEVY